MYRITKNVGLIDKSYRLLIAFNTLRRMTNSTDTMGFRGVERGSSVNQEVGRLAVFNDLFRAEVLLVPQPLPSPPIFLEIQATGWRDDDTLDVAQLTN